MAAPKRKPASKTAKTSKPSGAKSSPSGAKSSGARLLVVEARFYNDIADALLAGAIKALDEAKASFEVITVPGALEIVPAIAIAIDAAEQQKQPYDGVVALGCVIQGETFHFDIVAMQSARALIDFSIGRGLPCGNGILTTDNEAQAWARARLTEQDKGGDAARAALALIALKRQSAQK
jgi:6,7-dimethyl-8-ribityllumazine synthase